MKTKKSNIEHLLLSSEEFVEELGKEALFAETPEEVARDALGEIAEILDTVADENGISEEDDFSDDEEDALLDTTEEISASDEDEFGQIHQSFMKSALEQFDGKSLTIIEVGGPDAQIIVNPELGGEVPELESVEPVAPADVVEFDPAAEMAEEEAPLVIDEGEPVGMDMPGDAAPEEELQPEEEKEEDFLPASFRSAKIGKKLFSSIYEGKATTKNLSQGLKKPVMARKVTISASFKDTDDNHRRAWSAAVMRFSGKFQGFPATLKDFAYVQLLASKILQASPLYRAPVMDLSQMTKTGSPMRSLILSKMRSYVTAMRAMRTQYGALSGQEIESKLTELKASASGAKAEGLTAKQIASAEADYENLRKYKKIKDCEEGMNSTATPKKPFAMSSLLAKYLTNALSKEEAVKMFSALLKSGYYDQMDAQMKEDAGFLVQSKLLDGKGKILNSSFIKSEDGAWFDYDENLQGQPGGKSAAKLPGLPHLPGLPFLPNLLASANKLIKNGRAITSGQDGVTVDDGVTPSGTRSTTTAKKPSQTAGPAVRDEGLPETRHVELKRQFGNPNGPLGRGAGKFYAEPGDLPADHQAPGFGPVDPNSVTGIEHVEVVPLKIEASILYRLSPFAKINSSLAVASQNFEIRLSRKDAVTLGFPIDHDQRLFSARDIPQLPQLLSRAKLCQGYEGCKERTIIREDLHKALILKNSVHSTVLVKAGLVGGLKDLPYTTFKMIGENYVSGDGFMFPIASGLKYGRPEYLVINNSQKQFFAQKTQISASVSFADVLKKVDREILASARSDVSALAKKNDSMSRRFEALNAAYQAFKKETEQYQAVTSRKVAQLESVNSGLKQDLSAARLDARVTSEPRVPGTPVKSTKKIDAPRTIRAGAASILPLGDVGTK